MRNPPTVLINKLGHVILLEDDEVLESDKKKKQ